MDIVEPVDGAVVNGPDVRIVLAAAGVEIAPASEERSGTAHHHLFIDHAVAAKAIESDRAYVVDGSSYFNRSGPRVVDGIEILGALFHPDAFPHIRLIGRAARWP